MGRICLQAVCLAKSSTHSLAHSLTYARTHARAIARETATRRRTQRPHTRGSHAARERACTLCTMPLREKLAGALFGAYMVHSVLYGGILVALLSVLLLPTAPSWHRRCLYAAPARLRRRQWQRPAALPARCC